MQVVTLFPTAVGMFDLGRDLNEAEKGILLSQEMRPNMGNTTSADRFILRKEELGGLRSFIQKSINTYFEEIIAPSKEAKLYITQSWVNYSEPGQWHHSHEHPNSILSGVFYVQSDNEKDRIYFENNSYQQIQFPTEKYNLYNSKTWWLEAKQGRLVIFPSSLRHSVSAVTADKTRVSLSFNTFANGVIGAEENLTLLEVGQIYP
jgi:uncharacterized protein (TIGR02466 family)